MPHLHSAPGIALRLLVLAGLALCGTSAEAAEADGNQATPPDDTKLSGGRTAKPEPAQLEGIVVVVIEGHAVIYNSRGTIMDVSVLF